MNGNESASKCYWPKGLAKLMVIGFMAVASLCSGFWGVDGGGGTPRVSAVNSGKINTVFAAAPFKTTRVFPEKVHSENFHAPPEYVNVAFSKEHPTQLRPSNSWTVSLNNAFDWIIFGNGGTVGTPPVDTLVGPRWANTGCARIDAWFPDSINIEQAPTINDPNASITLDIAPPSEGISGDCAVWVYHYGTPPSKQ